MNTKQLAVAFHKIVAVVNASEDPISCWSTVLKITGQIHNRRLRAAAVDAEITSVAEQIKRTVLAEPIPDGVRSLYFGLFDEVAAGSEQTGYYISGWSGENPEQWDGEEPRYWPNGRYMISDWLNDIRREAVHKRDSVHREREVLEYAVTFGAAAILSRFAARSLCLGLPIFVGFDSGDCARVAN